MRTLLMVLAVLVLTFEADVTTNFYRRTTGDLYIESYYRDDGTYIPAHYKTRDDIHRYANNNSPNYERGMRDYFYRQQITHSV